MPTGACIACQAIVIALAAEQRRGLPKMRATTSRLLRGRKPMAADLGRRPSTSGSWPQQPAATRPNGMASRVLAAGGAAAVGGVALSNARCDCAAESSAGSTGGAGASAALKSSALYFLAGASAIACYELRCWHAGEDSAVSGLVAAAAAGSLDSSADGSTAGGSASPKQAKKARPTAEFSYGAHSGRVSYSGEVAQAGSTVPDGHGRMVLPDGEIYRGDFKGGKLQHGAMTVLLHPLSISLQLSLSDLCRRRLGVEVAAAG